MSKAEVSFLHLAHLLEYLRYLVNSAKTCVCSAESLDWDENLAAWLFQNNTMRQTIAQACIKIPNGNFFSSFKILLPFRV